MNYSEHNPKILWLWLTVAFLCFGGLAIDFILIVLCFGDSAGLLLLFVAIALALLLCWLSVSMTEAVSNIVSRCMRCLSVGTFKRIKYLDTSLDLILLCIGFFLACIIIPGLVAALALSKASKILSNRFRKAEAFLILAGTSAAGIVCVPYLVRIIWCWGDRC